MTNIVFSEKRTITSDFSPAEMLLISSTSPEEGRKYFFKKYLIPLVLTVWYQREADSRISNDSANVHLIPGSAVGSLRVHIAFEPTTTTSNLRVDQATEHRAVTEAADMVFKNSPPATWITPGASMSEALSVAFGQCLPSDWAERNLSSEMSRCPLIAMVAHRAVSGVDSITLNVLVKTRDRVRSEVSLTNQGEKKNAVLMIKKSQKYSKMYNVITGLWHGLCVRGSADVCEQCLAIFASPAAENAYDDPDLR